jgi:hypothetical protein
MASTYANRVLEGIYLLPAFWKIESDLYKKRNLTSKRYDKLVAKLKETQLIADRGMVWKKVNTLQTNYRREVKRLRDRERFSASVDDVYMPSLWYLNEINFLRDWEVPTEGRYTVDSEDKIFFRKISKYN